MSLHYLDWARRRWGNSNAYVLMSEARLSLMRTCCSLNRLMDDRRCLSLEPKPSHGRILLSFMIEPFLRPNEVLHTHSNHWISLEMAHTFLGLGYAVDVISYRNDYFVPERPYTALLDVRHNLARLAPLLDEPCIKLFHLDTAHILFHNAAEAQRLLMLQQRRGVTLRPRRHELPNMGIESADYATTTGNEFTIRTFAYANKPIFRLPIPAEMNRPWPDIKDWEAYRRRFLVFTSGGLAHKGLDLALEAFAGMSEYELTICAPLDDDEDFCRAYERELYQTPNIRTVGWVDVRSSQFFEIADSCAAVVHLSCSEGGGVSVINCMHAGLIPIVTYESSVDVHDFGVLVKSCAREEIQEAIRTVAALPAGHLKERSRRAWEHVTTHHTKERFSEAYRRIASTVLASSAVTS